MVTPNRPDLGSHPHVSQEPLRTGNPPETLADRESVIFTHSTDGEGRMWGGYFVVILAAVLLAVGGTVIWSMSGVFGR